MMIRFGYRTSGMKDPYELARFSILAEKSGFDSVWFPDHFVSTNPEARCLDVFSLIAFIGFNTNRIMLGTGVTDPLRRHPSSIG